MPSQKRKEQKARVFAKTGFEAENKKRRKNNGRGFAPSINYKISDLRKIQSMDSQIEDMVDYLKDNKIRYNKIFAERPTLNDVFLELTGKELRD